MSKSYLIKILSLLAGIVFLLSGIGKSIEAYEFSQILAQYGFEAFRVLAPFIIVFEIIVGLLLFFHIQLKQVSLVALCFVVVLSLTYLFGYFFANVTDCGCFGYLSFLNMSPFFTLIRNLFLGGILLYIFLKSENFQKLPDKSETMIVICILCSTCFVTGYTYEENKADVTHYVVKGKNIGVNVENSALSEFINFSEDSTYFVFVFSYSCPHCYNSIENLKQYERLGVADHVIALSLIPDSTKSKKFIEVFSPNFLIKHYPSEQIIRLTNRFPVSYLIKNNEIRMEIHGTLPCGYLLSDKLD